MMCYRDKTFCPYWVLCKKGEKCEDALTEFVREGAKKWWGKDDAPISYFNTKPKCFVGRKEEK